VLINKRKKSFKL